MTLRNCLSYWFPLVEATGVRVPETRIVAAPDGIGNLDYAGEEDAPPVPDLTEFEAALRKAIAEIGGYPCFLRTGMTSHKHGWDRTCFVTDPEKLMHHVFALVEFSGVVDFMGLPANVWVVRRLIHTKPLFHAFRNFPVTREFRVFVDGGKVACVHPYWPVASIKQGRPDYSAWEALLVQESLLTPAEKQTLVEIAQQASVNLPGAWSIDLLQDADGEWWVTDCADAGSSFHWEGCPNQFPRCEFVEKQ
jgi:ATP-grasp domain, R2K clade family 2